MGEPSAEEIARACSVQNDESREELLFAFGQNHPDDDDVGNRKTRQDMCLGDEGWGIALSKCSLVDKESNGLLSTPVGSLGGVGAIGSPDWSPLTRFSPDAEEEEEKSPPQEDFGNERVNSQQAADATTSAAVRKYIQSGKDIRVLLCIVLGQRGIENSDFRVGPYKLIKTKRKEKIPDMEMLQCEVHDRHAQQLQLQQQRNASAVFLQQKRRPSFPCSSKTKKEMLRWLLQNPRQLHPAERTLFQRELLLHLDSIKTKDGLALSAAAAAASSTESPDSIQIAIRQGALQRVQVRLSASASAELVLTDYVRGLYGELTNSLRREIGLLRADGRNPPRKCNANTTAAAMSKNLVLNWLNGRFAVVRNLIESTRMEQLASDIPDTYWQPLQELEHQATQILQEKDHVVAKG